MNQISVWVKNPRNDLYTPVQVVSIPKIGEKILLVENGKTSYPFFEVVDVVHTALDVNVGGNPTVDIYVKEIKKRSKLTVVRGRKA